MISINSSLGQNAHRWQSTCKSCAMFRKHIVYIAGARSRREQRTLTTLFRGRDIRSTSATTSFWLTLNVTARRPIISLQARISAVGLNGIEWLRRSFENDSIKA